MVEFELLRDLPLATGVALGSVAVGEVARMGLRRWFQGRPGRTLERPQVFSLESEPSAGSNAEPRGPQPWRGYRRFRVESTRAEGRGIRSIWLAPEDGRPLPAFLPGQFVTVRLTLPDGVEPSVRCYSLSDGCAPGRYRITVKRAGEKASASVSAFLVDQLREAETVELQAPKGGFVYDFADPRPPVFLAAGIGVTPLFTMAKMLAETEPARRFMLALGVRSGGEHPLKQELEQLASRHRAMRYFPLYSRPEASDRLAHDYVRQGRIDAAWLSGMITSPDHPFYLCGPQPFLVEATRYLTQLGVAPGDIRLEAFGPSSLPQAAPEATPTPTAPVRVRFSQSNKDVVWDDRQASLLDIAEKHGVSIPSGCRSGNCGTCAVRVVAGQFTSPPGTKVENGQCLACVARCAADDVVVEA